MSFAFEFTYGDTTISTAEWPRGSIESALRKGVTHILGNEVASVVTARKKAWVEDFTKQAKEAGDEIPGDLAPPDDVVAGWTAELRAEKLEALRSGLPTARTLGPRLDPVDSEMKKIAREKVFALLKANEIKIPKGGDEGKIIAAGQEISIGELIQRRLAREGDEIRKRAEKIVREREKEARFAREEAASKSGASSIEDLGL